jgi:hypothetical protein
LEIDRCETARRRRQCTEEPADATHTQARLRDESRIAGRYA